MHRGIARDETAYYGKKNSAEIVDVKAEASPVILQTRTDEPVQIQPENHAYRTAAFGYENILHICPRIIALRSKDKNDSSGISGARNQNANTIPVPMTM